MKSNKVIFFFGAGAEYCFGLPLGEEYTIKSILLKNHKLYNELKNYFGKFDNSYTSEALFSRADSALFRELIINTTLCNDGNLEISDSNIYKLIKKYNINSLESYDNLVKEKKDIIKNEIINVYKKFCIDYDEYDLIKYDKFIGKLNYYGLIEKDFSVIINPEKYGKKKFWRIFNYYWVAFMIIVIPILDNMNYFKDISLSDKYKHILENLSDVLDYIYDNVAILDEVEQNYYKDIQKEYGEYIKFVLTTNYTPFVEYYFKNKCAYLAGKLNLFEFPMENSVKSLDGTSHDKLFFPFIMTQSPIKPIISNKQIFEYHKAISSFNNVNYMIFIGYSFCENDYHILSMVKSFLDLDDNNKIIVCEYSSTKIDINRITSNLSKLLKVHDDKIIVLWNDGCLNTLIDKLDLFIE